LKIQNTTYERSQTEREILNQVQATFNQLVNTNTLLQQQNAMASNYQRLLQGELLNLENGESDLFKINVQQEKLIQSQSKLLKLRAEFEKQKASLYWAAGLRNLSLDEN
jgi:outer membrane protein TolC